MTLTGTGIGVHFEGVKALDGVDIELRRGEILGLIGPNGAGKTTLVNALTGFQVPTHGRLLLGDDDVTGQPPHRLARRGVSRTFQSGRSFPDLTVLENVEAGPVGLGVRRREAAARARAALDAVGLDVGHDTFANALTSGQERRLEVARAIAMRPRFLFLDEPAAGLNETEGDELVKTVAVLPAQLECGVLVIEHDMRVIMGLCDRLHVIDHGQTIAQGDPEVVRTDPAVVEAYLGSGATDGAA
jgi:branched-chain amino acid transport system ATP-binding protein